MADNKFINWLAGKDSNPGPSRRPILRIVISLIILSVGVGTASYLKNSAPRTQKTAADPADAGGPGRNRSAFRLSDYRNGHGNRNS